MKDRLQDVHHVPADALSLSHCLFVAATVMAAKAPFLVWP